MKTQANSYIIHGPDRPYFETTDGCRFELQTNSQLKIVHEIDDRLSDDGFYGDIPREYHCRMAWIEVSGQADGLPIFTPGVLHFRAAKCSWITRPVVNIFRERQVLGPPRPHEPVLFTSSYNQIVEAMLESNAIHFPEAKVGELSRPILPQWLIEWPKHEYRIPYAFKADDR